MARFLNVILTKEEKKALSKIDKIMLAVDVVMNMGYIVDVKELRRKWKKQGII